MTKIQNTPLINQYRDQYQLGTELLRIIFYEIISAGVIKMLMCLLQTQLRMYQCGLRLV